MPSPIFAFDSARGTWQLADQERNYGRAETRVVKRKWGVKRTCPGCGARFYDLNREKRRCPTCGAEYVAGNPAKPRHRAAPLEPPPAVEPEPVPPPEDEHVVPLKGVVETVEDDEDVEDDVEKVKGDDDGVIEDASELREDDDDVSEVREHLDDAVEDKT